MRYRVRNCLVDADLFELRRAGERLEVQPKVLSLLIFLLEHRQRAVSKDEILDAVWPGITTSEGSLTRAVSVARAALGDADIIRTVRGRGYRIAAPVEVEPSVPAPAAASGAAPTAPRSDFVCRERELSLARDALVQAMAGRGRVLLLAGEPGIGKTRLAEEVGAIARERGGRVHWGRCVEGDGGPAFWPWIQILRSFLKEESSPDPTPDLLSGLGELAEIVPELRDRLPDLPPPGTGTAKQARFRLFDAIVALLRQGASRAPLVLVLDDLQSADDPSLRLLEFLAPELVASPILLVATYRDVELEASEPLERTLGELARSQSPRRTVFLRGLTEACVRRFTEGITGIEPSPELLDTLHRRTDGNPLFLVELLHWLETLDRPWHEGARSWDTVIPEGIRQVIGSRLAALPDACLELLEAAAVIGRNFSVPVLARACDLSEEAALDQLEAAERARVVEPTGDGPAHFHFSHVLVAETLYDRLATKDRVRLHRRVAEALEALYTPRAVAPTDLEVGIAGEHLSELARHYGEAAIGGDTERAVDYCERAARHATDVLAFEEAARHAEQALRILESSGPVDESRRCKLLIGLGVARFRSGDPQQANDALQKAVESARASGEAMALARAAILVQRYSVGGNVFLGNPERIRLMEEALAGLGAEDVPLRASLLTSLATEVFFAGDEAKWKELSRESVELARRLGDKQTLWNVLQGQRLHVLNPRTAPQRTELTEELLALARELGDGEREFLTRINFRLWDRIDRADAPAVDREMELCVQLARELRQPLHDWAVTRGLASRALWQGRLEEAGSLLHRAREQGRRSGEGADLSFHSAILPLRRMQGRFAELEPDLKAVHRLPLNRGHKWAALALVYASQDRLDEARAEFDAIAADGFGVLRRDSNFAYNLALLSETCAALGDRQRAEELCALLEPWARHYVVIPTVVTAGCGSRYLGTLTCVLEDWEAAERHFEDALEIERRMKARPYEAYALRDYARMLEARGGPGDARAAREQKSQARAIAAEIGLAL